MKVINDKYKNLGSMKNAFLSAEPYPHIVLDDFLDADFFQTLKNNFEDKADDGGKSFDSAVEEKKWISLNSSLPDIIKKIVDAFNTPEWVENMRSLTGIPSLVATPNGNTKLANYHIMKPGGILGPHVDHSSEPEKGIPHILNIILYLSEGWKDENGGATQLFDKRGNKVISRVPYKENRVVIFLHTPYSFHGVERINKETKEKRRTIYVDYYSESYQPFKDMKLNFDSTWFKHGTTFKLNNRIDYFKSKNKNYTKTMLYYHFNRIKAKLHLSQK